MGITFKTNEHIFSMYVYKIKFIPNIEKELNKIADNSFKLSDFATKENTNIDSFLDGFGGLTEQFLKLTAYKDCADIGTDYTEAIYLPLPNSLDETYDQSFQADNLNLLYDVYKYTFKNSTVSSIADFYEKLMLRANAVIDKNLLMIYMGSKPRTITASWNLVPRSQDEFNLLRENILKLYNYSSAIRDKIKFFNSNIPINYLNQDNIFRLKIEENGKENRLSKLLGGNLGDGFFITNITTNINLSNSPLRYDASPSNFSLTINFTERKPLWYDHWQKQIEESL